MRRLSRTKRNVIRRLNARLDRICMEAREATFVAIDNGNSAGKTYEEIVRPIGRKLYSNPDVIDIKRKLKALGVKGINL